MKLFSSLALTLVLLSGCGARPPLPTAPAQVPVAPITTQKPVTEAPKWMLDLPKGVKWNTQPKESPKSGNSQHVELLVRSEKELGQLPVIIQVMSFPGGNNAFIEKMFLAFTLDDNTNVLKVVESKTPGAEGIVVFMAHRIDEDSDETVAAMFSLITASSDRGFVVTCAGDIDFYEAFGGMCASTLKSFRFVTKG